MEQDNGNVVLRHQLSLSVIGILCGALGMLFVYSGFFYYSSWYSWNKITVIVEYTGLIVSAGCLCCNLYLFFAAAFNRLRNAHRNRVIVVCVVYFAAALLFGFAYNALYKMETGYIHEATVVKKSVDKASSYYTITVKPSHEDYTVKLYCNITEYNLIEVNRRYSPVQYIIFDKSDDNKGILKNMSLMPEPKAAVSDTSG